MREGLGNGRLGDFVEYHPLSPFGGDLNGIHQVPGNRFTLPVRVGCQENFAAFGSQSGNFAHNLFLFIREAVLWREIVFNIYTQLGFQQVANMPNGCHHMVLIP